MRNAKLEHTGWCVGVHPKSADLPIIGRSEVLADDQDQAVVVAKGRIDGALSLLACDLNEPRRFQSHNNACLRT